MNVPEWWLIPDFLFTPSVYLWVGWGLYGLWRFVCWVIPSKRRARAIRRIEADFKVKEREQELELELANRRDKYNRDKVYWDRMTDYVSPGRNRRN